MLSADKNVTLTEFQIQTLQIREKELNYFVNLYNSISGKLKCIYLSFIFHQVIMMTEWKKDFLNLQNHNTKLLVGIAAMLAGFGFSSLKMNFPNSTPMVVEIVYLAVTACAVGLELCAILNAACCSVFGKLLHLPNTLNYI